MDTEEPRRLVVPEGVAKARADKILCEALPEMSRAAVQRLFDEERVRLGGRPIAKNRRVSAGDVLVYDVPPPRPAELVPVEISLDILFEDEHLVAVNKPPGMVVHPGAGTGEDTLVHALLAHCRGRLSGIGGVERPGIVHRLDRDTSGVIVVAKSDAAHRGLSAAFAARETEKAYLALVAGRPRLLSGTIKLPITRHHTHRTRMMVARDEESGRFAHTDWKVEETFPRSATLLRCRIHTGRTHQIRVHMQALGHPILGDSTYGWRMDGRLPRRPPRVMLHAAQLAFAHPITQARVELEAPLPTDFRDYLVALGE
ncbi:MAG: RluA family pseudouridine synthase [Verrucomicrobia bacterium]|nr:MAG: RluA family pseudouridine synthase [Verrucomicrobiota bacterium]